MQLNARGNQDGQVGGRSSPHALSSRCGKHASRLTTSDRLLYSRVADNVTVRFGAEVESFEQDEAQVRVAFTDGIRRDGLDRPHVPQTVPL